MTFRTDLALQFDRLKISEIEDKSKTPAFSYIEKQDRFFNTKMSVLDTFGDYFPSVKAYIRHRFENTAIQELPEGVEYLTTYYWEKLKIDKIEGGVSREHQNKITESFEKTKQQGYGIFVKNMW